MNKLQRTALAIVGIVSILLPYQGSMAALSVPDTGAIYDSFLASSIQPTDTSMTLSRGTYNDETPLSGFTCFTLDSGTPSIEYVCGTASSTSVTSLTRGISFSNPNATSTALRLRHGRGASVKITDYPSLQIMRRKLNGTDTIPNVLTYDASVATSTIYANGSNLVSVNLLSDTVAAGCVNASETARGCTELSTAAEAAAGTSLGSTGARLVAPGSLLNATQSATTIIPVTSALGKLSQAFQDLAAAWTFSGTLTSNGTTVLTGPIVVSSTSALPVVRTYSAATTTDQVSTWTKPANLRYITIEVQGPGGGGGGSATTNKGGAGGGGGGFCRETLAASVLTANVTVTAGGAGAGGIGNVSGSGGSTSSFGSYCNATGGAGGTHGNSAGSGGDPGVGSGGDINLTGSGGGGEANITAVPSGMGGSSFFGGGGGGVLTTAAGGVPGVAGKNGGGGGGAYSGSGGGSTTGGQGGGGLIVVTEYYL